SPPCRWHPSPLSSSPASRQSLHRPAAHFDAVRQMLNSRQMRNSWDPTQLLARRARDLLANAGPSYAPPREQVLRLAAGVPDPAVFPVEELVQTFERMLRSRGELA